MIAGIAQRPFQRDQQILEERVAAAVPVVPRVPDQADRVGSLAYQSAGDLAGRISEGLGELENARSFRARDTVAAETPLRRANSRMSTMQLDPWPLDPWPLDPWPLDPWPLDPGQWASGKGVYRNGPEPFPAP